MLILSLVTWDRFVSVTQPLARRQPSAKAAVAALLLLWGAAAGTAAAPLLDVADAYFGDEFYGSNGVCLSLHIHEPYAMVIVFNSKSSFRIVVLFLRVGNTRQSCSWW